MIPTEKAESYAALTREIETLRAENGRLREALKEIAGFSGTDAFWPKDCARATLAPKEVKP